jgi:hypothetical protein
VDVVTPQLLTATAAGATLGTGLFLLALALTTRPTRNPARPGLLRNLHRRRTPARTRWLRAALLGVSVLVATRWVIAGTGAALLAAHWDRIAGGGGEERLGILRLEGLATWTESLRDTIAGAVGLEQAIPATAATAPAIIRPSLNLLVDRLRIREPLPDALRHLAEDLDDPSADVICSALVLNARLRGPGLRDVLTALAASIREELDMRRRIEAGRRSIRRSVKLVITIVLGVMAALAVLNRTYVAPYDTFLGQIVLLMVGLLFLAGLLWLRRLATAPPAGRFLVLENNPQKNTGPGPGASAATVTAPVRRPGQDATDNTGPDTRHRPEITSTARFLDSLDPGTRHGEPS